MNPAVIRAVFKRNFIAYFVSPAGYVFLCVFAALTAFATFVPNEFFNANLANLDQLNRYLPYILLVFIPAITMSIWAEERRQGTDELLLTIPASDLDVVLGKYLAAVAVYTVALIFSLTNVVCLSLLGSPDLGLLFANYVGYWIVGLAMLAIGMVASFLTGNLTVGFIMGAVFNAPLVFAEQADAILPLEWARSIQRLSIAEQFRDFGRGVISFSAVVYFLLIVVVMLYVSMVLIGRRHWWGGRLGRSLLGHYVTRALALFVLLAASTIVLARYDRRVDVTTEKLSSLAPQTIELLEKLDVKRPVRIDAYVSPVVPESYVQTRLNLLNVLREFQAIAGDKVVVRVHETESLSPQEDEADKKFGIKGQQVASRIRGTMNIDEIFMGVAFTSGLDKVVVPFIDRGVPVEYELVRSIATVSQQSRKKVGILNTDAKLYGSFNMQTMNQTQNELIVTELEKQYEVVQVNADAPITEKYDVLLAVQPSSLTQEQMNNFLAAVMSGQPTAVFEDPFPYLDPNVPGTSAERRPQGGMMGMQQPPQPKGDITPLWQSLGINFNGAQVVWQDYNPYPKIGQFPPEFVFVDKGQDPTSTAAPFNDDSPISSKLQQVLFLFPGSIQELNASGLKVTPLVVTGTNTGRVQANEILQQSFLGGGGLNEDRAMVPTHKSYLLGAYITGKPGPAGGAAKMSDEGLQLAQAEQPAAETPAVESPATEAPPAAAPPAVPATPPAGEVPAAPAAPAAPAELNVVVVADIDVLYSAFFALRARGEEEDAEVNLTLDNVSFVLNVLDVLAKDERFVEIRKRRPTYRTLTRFEAITAAARDYATAQRKKFADDFDTAKNKEQEVFDRKIKELEGRTDIDPQQKVIEMQLARDVGQRRLDAAFERLKNERERREKQIDRDKTASIQGDQNRVKILAVATAPIMPLLLAGIVMFNLRARERQTTTKERLRG
ncbi:MAG: Gldg family protein [Pirellulales bacterium]|nr:Gldg family protein [Pirellulales bacterium]